MLCIAIGACHRRGARNGQRDKNQQRRTRRPRPPGARRGWRRAGRATPRRAAITRDAHPLPPMPRPLLPRLCVLFLAAPLPLLPLTCSEALHKGTYTSQARTGKKGRPSLAPPPLSFSPPHPNASLRTGPQHPGAPAPRASLRHRPPPYATHHHNRSAATSFPLVDSHNEQHPPQRGESSSNGLESWARPTSSPAARPRLRRPHAARYASPSRTSEYGHPASTDDGGGGTPAPRGGGRGHARGPGTAQAGALSGGYGSSTGASGGGLVGGGGAGIGGGGGGGAVGSGGGGARHDARVSRTGTAVQVQPPGSNGEDVAVAAQRHAQAGGGTSAATPTQPHAAADVG